MNTYEVTASDLTLNLSTLYSISTIVNTNAAAVISVNPSVPLSIMPMDFFSRLTVEIKGQKTNNTEFTNCVSNEAIQSLIPQESFTICILTTIADLYDLYLYYDGVLLPEAPVYSGLKYSISMIHVGYTRVEGLQSVISAGEGSIFSVTLFDEYNNTIPQSMGYSIHFTNNSNRYITTSSGPNPDIYYFELFFNHTIHFSFQILVNNIVFNTIPYSVEVVASNPSYLSTISYVSTSILSVLSSIEVLFFQFVYDRFKSICMD